MKNVLDFGADPTGDSDSLPAFEAAIASVAQAKEGPYDGRGGMILVPAGTYRMDGQLRIRRCVALQGEGGWGRFAATRLMFTAAERVMPSAEHFSCVEITGFDGETPARGDHTSIRDLEIQGPGRTVFGNHDEPIHGVYAWGVCDLHGVTVRKCSGDGIRMDGTDARHSELPSKAVRNVNDWAMRLVRVEDVDGWGFNVDGQDANGGRAWGCSVIGASNGIRDSGYLSNTWTGCLVENMGGESIVAEGFRKLFLGCCVENGSNPVRLEHPTGMWIGGTIGPGFAATEATILRDGQIEGVALDALLSRGIVLRSKNVEQTREIVCRLAPQDGRTFFDFQLNADPYAFGIRDNDQWLSFLRYEGSPKPAAVEVAGDGARLGSHSVDPGTMLLRARLEGHGGIVRWVGYGREDSAKPGQPDVDASGPTGNRPWIDGDRIYDTHPNSHVGWLRIDGTWKRFGAIEP